MNNCLFCDASIVNGLTWSSLLYGKHDSQLCTNCSSKLMLIEGEVCLRCFKNTEGSYCNDCRRWSTYFENKDPLTRNIATFSYNSFLKDMVTKWKYRGDVILGEAFKSPVKKTVHKYYRHILKEAYIVPIPLSEDRLKERCFNQSLIIASFITDHKKRILDVLERIDSEKQSKKSKYERIYRKNPFKLRKNVNKTVILVDDIYTTGTTLRHAASLLVESGCPNVYSYTLIRG